MDPVTASIIGTMRLMREEALNCLDGVTDEEYFWEPVPGMWSVCRRELGRVDELAGSGDWALEFPSVSPDPPPLTSVAWRLAHLYLLNSMYNDHIFGAGTLTFDDIPIQSTAAGAVAAWLRTVDDFIDNVSPLAAEELNRVVSAPWNEKAPVHTWAAWFTVHNVHHCAEIGCIRDVYRELGTGRPASRPR